MRLPRLRQKGRAYYFDTQQKPRKWIALGSDRSAALKEYDKLLAQYGEKGPRGSVSEMLREFRHGLSGVAESTGAQYKTWAAHLEAVFGELPADSLTQADIRKYASLCPRKNVRGELSLLRQAYWKWLDAGKLQFNPCAGVTVDKKAKPRPKRDRLIDDAELAAIIKASPEYLRIAISLAYILGLRIGDILKLQWGQFEDGGHVRTQKTGARQRFALTDDLRHLLDRARALQGRIGSVYVLCGRGGQPVNYWTARNAWKAACAAAGVKDAKFHDIRASAGTDAEEQGRNATKLLGHTSEQTTRTYLRGRKVQTIEPLRRKAGM